MNRKFFASSGDRPYLIACCFMLLSAAAFSAMNTGVRYLGAEFSAPLIVVLRNAVTLLLLMPAALRNDAALLRTKRLKDHARRGSVGGIGMILWTYCLTIMPLNSATALSFTAPLFVTLFAVAFLGEKASRTLWISLGIGFAGTLVILHPTPQDFHWNSLLIMLVTAGWAVVGIMVKSLTRTEPPLRIVFYMNFFMFLIALPFGLYQWKTPDMHQWVILLGIAICSITMHFSLAKAYSLAPVASLMPLDYTRMIYTALFAYWVFGEKSDFNSWLGGAIILSSAMLSTRAKRRDAKAAPLGSE